MNLSYKHLWKVPVYCIAASWLTFNITAYIGGHFFTVTTMGTDGIPVLSADPTRVAIFNGGLFLAVLLVGRLWAFRSMTRQEIVVSAAFASVIYLILVLAQLCFPNFPIGLSIVLAYIQNWTATAASLLTKISGSLTFSVILASFSPMLFIPIGRK